MWFFINDYEEDKDAWSLKLTLDHQLILLCEEIC
jgi:hypothetical protein